MKNSTLQYHAIRVAMMGALLAGTATLASAQQVRPTSEAVAKAEDHRQKKEKAAFAEAREEAKALLKDVKLTTQEERSREEIETKYSNRLKDLEKGDESAEKAGIEDLKLVDKIHAVRLQQRADLRNMLVSQHALFDNNVIILEAMKARVLLVGSRN
jgi:hypothetical protein